MAVLPKQVGQFTGSLVTAVTGFKVSEMNLHTYSYSVQPRSVKTAMFIQTMKHNIAPPYQQGVVERLLNSARGPVAES